MAGACGSHWSHGGQGWEYSQRLSKGQATSLTLGVPIAHPDPRRTPASRDKPPSVSMGLGHMGPGSKQLAYVAANPQTPPGRPTHCEDRIEELTIALSFYIF